MTMFSSRLAAAMLLIAVAASAQVPPAPAAPPPMPAAPGPGLFVNVRVDVTIVDEGGPQPIRKTVSLTTTDRQRASVRSIGRPAGSDPLLTGTAGNYIPLNVDVVPQIFPDGRIQARINIEYRPNSTDPKTTVSQLTAEFRPILENGKKLVISQAADPTSDRRVSVEVTATILK